MHNVFLEFEIFLLQQEQGKKSRSIRRNSHRSSVKNSDVFLPVVDAVHVWMFEMCINYFKTIKNTRNMFDHLAMFYKWELKSHYIISTLYFFSLSFIKYLMYTKNFIEDFECHVVHVRSCLLKNKELIICRHCYRNLRKVNGSPTRYLRTVWTETHPNLQTMDRSPP